MSIIKYMLVGVANTAVGLTIIYLLMLADVSMYAANFFGYAVGICFSFCLNKLWTFQSRQRVSQAFPKFLLVTAVAYLANILAVWLSSSSGADRYVSQAVGIIPYFLVGFLGSKIYAFKAR